MQEERQKRIPMALTVFGIPHLMGHLRTKAGETVSVPLGVPGLIDAADKMGLAGVEMPLPSADVLSIEALRDLLAEHDQRFVMAYGILREEKLDDLRQTLRAAAALGARVVRAVLSDILCGDRRARPESWETTLDGAARCLRQALPEAEASGLSIAVENHQDATSDDLLRLWEMVGYHAAFGVTLDTGNPLAVGEDPVEYAERIAPLIRHLHLKDYTIHFAPSGYRLVRCAAGAGVIDFPAILEIASRNRRDDFLPGIEGAAQATRTIPLLEPSWWACYPPTPSTRLVPALRLLWEKGRPADEPYGSAWERGGNSATVAAEEWGVLRRSVDYFHALRTETTHPQSPPCPLVPG